MSNAERNPTPKNKHLDPVARFNEDYAHALVDADVSAAHSGTEGWQRLYAAQRKADRDARRAMADELRNLADRIEVRQLEDDEVKEFAAAKTAYVEAADAAAGFERSTVSPVREPVERCDKIIADALAHARAEEERTPLHNMGLEDLMRTAVGGVRRPRWDADHGRVVLADADPTEGEGA